MNYDSAALDRYITGNYGDDQFRNLDCGKPMRDGYCQLDPDHRGRHTTVAFYCDACGQMRRGSSPTAVAYDVNGDVDVEVCWFCVNVTHSAEQDRIVNA